MPPQEPSRRTGRRPTLKQVADALGVSIATVSNAFNRPNQLSPALRDRVLAEAARHGLRAPDPAARSLRRGRSGALGVIYTDQLSYAFSDPAAVLFLKGVSAECELADLDLVLIPRSSTATPEETAVGRSVVDGIIVYSVAEDDPLLSAARRRGLPLVVVDQPATIATRPWVGVEDEIAAADIARHLFDLGHRRVGVISSEMTRERTGGPADISRQAAAAFHGTAARLRGYRRAAEEAGISWRDVPVIEATDNSEEQGNAAARALLTDHPLLTALLAMTDQLALGALRAAEELGLSVPATLSVAGFDDLPAAAAHRPALTTVHQPHEEKGRVAARILLRHLAGDDIIDLRRALPHELRVRSTTAPPSA
jgi:DNA-binding LacI/PurR family transcriptional regulator